MKKCSKCDVLKEFSDFNKNKWHSDGLASQCRKCVNEKKRTPEYRLQANKAKRKRYQRPDVKEDSRKRSAEFRKTEKGQKYVVHSNLIRLYGIGLEQYNQMFADQNGCCAICLKHQSEFPRRLNVDHDHDTGKVRSLLCHHCNTALGGFGEDIDLMMKAIDYLNKHTKGKDINGNIQLSR